MGDFFIGDTIKINKKQMTPEQVKEMIDKAIEVAMNRHNRNATLISAALGFAVMAAFVDGLLRILGKIPPFIGLDVNIIPDLLKQWTI